MRKKIIAITLGDPASIGPEITIKALTNQNIYEKCAPVVIGDICVLNDTVRRFGFDIKINCIHAIEDAYFKPGTIDVYDMNIVKNMDNFEYGKVSKEAGEAAFQYVKKAICLAMEQQVDATVTNAINKKAINIAGHHFSGHTEIYAQLTGTSKYTMMLIHENMRVVHVSTHVSLREAVDRVKKDRVLEVIRIANQACKTFGIAQPKVGVAGLNPHSGENGMFGMEEIEEITPAIETAIKEGIIVDGPVPPDTIFSKLRGGWYDIVVAMYHDQGHIPLKLVGFVYDENKGKWNSVSGVNVTLGLPIIRTSVDHGTAFDQVHKGTASEDSLLNAIDCAVKMAKNR